MLRKIFFTVLTILLLSTTCYAKNVRVVVDGNVVVFEEQQPTIIDGRTLVPVRGVFDKLGYSIDWNANSRTVFMNNGTRSISIKIGEYGYSLNDSYYQTDVPAQIISGSTMLPLRAVSNAAGCDVEWNDTTKMAFITSPSYVDDGTISTVIKWETSDGKLTVTTPVTVSRQFYEYYGSLQREYCPDYLYDYIYDENNKDLMHKVVEGLRKAFSEHGYDDNDLTYEVIQFVQGLRYEYDNDSHWVDEYPKYPVETLIENGGDCEDVSMLLVGLLKELNRGLCYVVYSDHVAVGLWGNDDIQGTYFYVDGKKYFYIEATNMGWHLGEYPPNMPNEATIKVVN